MNKFLYKIANCKPKSFFECLKGPWKNQFIAAAKIMFHKNRGVVVFSKPFPRNELPKDVRVLRTLLVPEFKSTDIPNVFECKVRDCTVGTPQEKGRDFPQSYCAVFECTSFRLVACISASNGNIICVLDVKNAFQTLLFL